MEVTDHVPVRAGGLAPASSAEPVLHAHAVAWIELHVADWDVWRRGHLHLARRLDRPEPWGLVDLSRHPLAPARDCPRELPTGVREELLSWLAEHELVLYRATAVGTVSELGEPLEAFRTRLLALLRPELTYRMKTSAPHERRELAAAVARTAGDIEERVVPDVTAAIRRLEVGLLLAPEELRLDEARRPPVLRPRPGGGG